MSGILASMDLKLGSLGFQEFSTRMALVAPTNADWPRLGKYVTRRRDELGMTQSEVQAAGGPSTATVRNIENGSQTSYRSGVLAALERALRWGPGSVEAILDGREPVDSDAVGRPAVTPGVPGFDTLAAWLRSVAANPNREPALRAWAEAQLDQLARLREADLAAGRERGEAAS